MAEASASQESGTNSEASDPKTQTTERPDSIPETLWDAEKGSPKLPELAARFGELSALEQAQAERAKDIPAEGKYELRVPADLKLPAGMAFKPDPNMPLAKELLDYAAENKLTQGEVDRLTGLYAKSLLAEEEAAAQEYLKEKQALGSNAEERITAAETWLGGVLTPNEFQAMRAVLLSAAGVTAIEKIRGKVGAARMAGNGEGSGNGAGPDISKMTPGQRIDYANRQSAMRGQ